MRQHTYAVYWNTGKITTKLVNQAIATYQQKFNQQPGVIVTGPHRTAEVRPIADACGLPAIANAGLLSGEFWLGGSSYEKESIVPHAKES